MNRKESILNIRPQLPILTEAVSSSAERFQNQVLRPILKLQNLLILAIFRNYLQERKGVYYGLNLDKKMNYIQNAIQKDNKVKQLLMGLVIGQFTVEEWYIYEKDKQELGKRIRSLLIQRIHSQMDQL